MLLRFEVQNVLSFGKMREFNMFPQKGRKSDGPLYHHIQDLGTIKALKQTAIYGANGSGKSNLINSIRFLQDLVLGRITGQIINSNMFKFTHKDDVQMLNIEFEKNKKFFIFGLEIKNGIIILEELYEHIPQSKISNLLYERKTTDNSKLSLKFSKDIDSLNEVQVLKKLILRNFTKPKNPLLEFLANLEEDFLSEIKICFEWFKKDLNILSPKARLRNLINKYETDIKFNDFLNDTLKTLGIGISSVRIHTEKIDKESSIYRELSEIFENHKEDTLVAHNDSQQIAFTINENNDIEKKNMVFCHTINDGQKAELMMDNESDGTIKLLHLMPVIEDLYYKDKVYIIDEIERSIHPILIKEIIRKFSLNASTKGQLVFSTHESHLLDLDIFSSDEIWLLEKNKNGESDLYTLSDYKPHNTINIRRGYLNGRYGAIPFLGNLSDLSWGNDVSQ